MVQTAPGAQVSKLWPKGKPPLARWLRFVYPPRCVACGEDTRTERGLCAACWSDMHYVTAPFCDACGLPLPGDPSPDRLLCDGCLTAPQSWRSGRAVVVYGGTGRRIVLALKHGDRLDIAKSAGRWMAAAAADLLAGTDVIAPVPLHWTRLFRRRYNQAALLASEIGALSGRRVVPDMLVRRRRTLMQKGMTRHDRVENQRQAIFPHPGRLAECAGRRVLLVDDVLTTGATLSACAEACFAAGAADVNAVVLARVATGERFPIS